MRFYCIEHQQDIYTGANHVGRVTCREGSEWHHIGHNFPAERYWEYCHGCRAIWFYKQEDFPREKCPACKRGLVLSHLCHRCETLRYRLASAYAPDTPTVVRDASCGSCGAEIGGAARWHFCLTLGRPYLTARDACPYCSAGFFPVTSDDLSSALANGDQYQRMRLKTLSDDRPTLVVASGKDDRDALFGLLAGQHDAIVLPWHETREKIEQESRRFRRVFDWSADWAGDLVVVRPAIFERDGSKWRLKEPGLLTGTGGIGFAAADASLCDMAAAKSVTPEATAIEAVTDEAVEPVVATPHVLPPEVATREVITNEVLKLGAETAERSTSIRIKGDGVVEEDAAVGPSTEEVSSSKSAGREAKGPPRPEPTKGLVKWAVAVASVLLIGVVLIWSLRESTRAGNENGHKIDTSVSPTPTPPAPPTPSAPDGMAYFPAGSFTMGRDDGTELERPAHTAAVEKAFFIDKREVSCKEYETFLAAHPDVTPPASGGWVGRRCPPGQEQLPVTGVDWDHANAYAQWRGGRLPTEKEWEYAAREGRNVLYPWGDGWRPNAANAGRSQRHLAPADSYHEGATPSGLLNMVGNVWEWTDSDLSSYDGRPLPQSLNTGESVSRDGKVIRGGSWNSNPQQATTTYRIGYPPRGARDYSNTGFRCAKDAPPH